MSLALFLTPVLQTVLGVSLGKYSSLAKLYLLGYFKSAPAPPAYSVYSISDYGQQLCDQIKISS